MTHDEIVNLIRSAVDGGDIWADFGAGRGAFTRALRDVLGDAATIYAIDRDAGALRSHAADIRTIQANFTQSIDLPPLDGLLAANALHFVMRQTRAIERLSGYLKPGRPFIVVEYDRRLPWTPFPLPYDRFQAIASQVGLTDVRQIATRTSSRNGVTMYAAVGLSPL